MIHRRRTVGVLLSVGLGLLSCLATVPTAQAATGSAPVTQPDAAGSVYPGNFTLIAPLANDSDPDGDQLAICRLGTETYKGLQVDFQGVDLAVAAGPRVKPGAYTFTYYACDFSYLTPGTITVTVEKPLEFTVKKIDGRPGKLRVTNGAPFSVRFLYGSFAEEGPDGTLRIKKGDSVVITVHRTQIDWIATSVDGEIFVGGRSVRHIKLPPGDHPPAAGRIALPSALERAWHGA